MSTPRRIGAFGSAVVLLGLAACTAGRGPSPSAGATVSALPTATATASVATSPRPRAPQSTLREVDPNPLAQITDPGPAAWSGTRFVIAVHPAATASSGNVTSSFSRASPSHPGATGSNAAPAMPNQPYPPVEFLTSPDGETWSTSGEAGTGQPRAYAFDGNGPGIAVGYGAHGGAVWTSPDSRTWTRLPEPTALLPSTGETGLWLDDVAHGPAGYVALGTVDHPQQLTPAGFTLPRWSAVFLSSNGRNWLRESDGAFGHAFLKTIVTINGRYVISGQAEGSTSLVLWTSTDGRSWTKEPAPGGVAWNAARLAAVPDEGLLLATEADGCAAWRSSDGLAWTSVSQGCAESSDSLMAGPSAFVAYTSTPGTCALTFAEPNLYFCAAVVEVSADGEQWTSLRLPTASGEVIAASANELLWRGPRASGDEQGLWIADLGTGQ